MKTGWFQAVKAANPSLTDEQVQAMIDRSVTQERDLVLRHGLNLDQARELTRAELFPGPTKT